MRLARGLTATAAAIVLVAASAPAEATVITGPVDLSTFTSGATYGPAAPAHFTEAGPVTSGTATPLFTGSSYADVNSLLLVISGAIPTGEVVTLTFDGLPSVTFTSANFVSTEAAGFSKQIGGIGNGDVNGIVFATALHAGAELAALPTGLTTNSVLGGLTISEKVVTDLRVDVFGGLDGRIVSNASNGGALGLIGSARPTGRNEGGPLLGEVDDPIVNNGGTALAGGDPVAVPEPSTLALLTTSLLGIGFAARLRRR